MDSVVNRRSRPYRPYSSGSQEFIDPANLIAKMDAWGIDITFVLPLSEHPEGLSGMQYGRCD